MRSARLGIVVGLLSSFLGLIAVSIGGVATKPVTFAEEIAQLFQQHCQVCHRPGGGAPFSLITYEDAYRWRYQVLDATQSRRMPPWKPAPGYGDFSNEMRLSAAEVSLIARWVQDGGPQGEARHLPPPREFTDTWTLGKPDRIFAPDSTFTMPAEARDVYRCFSVSTDFNEDRYIAASEVMPGNPRIVHHVLVYIDRTGRSWDLDRRDVGPGYTCFGSVGVASAELVAAWVPGSRSYVMPEGVGMLVPARSRLIIQVHYHNHPGTEQQAVEVDLTRVGIHLAKGRVDRRLRVIDIRNMTFVIPAGAERHEVRAQVPIRRDLHVLGIAPHMHLLGREMKVTALLPDGTVTPLIYIDDWDFRWQGAYFYKKPLALPAGTRIQVQAVYDNSAGNPRNPSSPPRDVRWGERSEDEMCLAYVLVTLDGEKLGHEAR